ERSTCYYYFFFLQEEDGIRCATVTGVQTFALPIWTKEPPTATSRAAFTNGRRRMQNAPAAMSKAMPEVRVRNAQPITTPEPMPEIGRASCREREKIERVAIGVEKK